MSEHYTIARIIINGERFEILVKPESALSFRLGKKSSVSEVLITDTIFQDAGKGLKSSEEKIRKAFGTLDTTKIAGVVLQKGTLQITTEQRRRLTEDKKRQIVSFISRQCVDPRTNFPHPPSRIEQAMSQIHYSIDPFVGLEEQAKEIIKLLKPILPLKIESTSVSIRIPTEYAGKVYGIVKGFGEIKREEWKADGSLLAIVEVPAGLYGSLLEKLGEKTRGNVETKIVE
jgi:ribosome maturation protein SDO1